MPPETIAGRYEVLREIGRGGMGAVWLCRDRVLGREVAAKQLGGLPGESTPHLARALREARTSAALSHPNVVSIFDAVEEGDHVWLVMEHVPSRTLSELTRTDGPLEPRRAARIGAQIADGLAAAHARGTIHRDVKPGNVLVGEDDLAKISDFGIARSTEDETLTQTGMVTGTPTYFSPQLARGAAPTPADDVWALGATLFTAVEGHPPWPQQTNAIAMLVHIAEHEPPSPGRAGALGPVVSRMMAAEPGDRPTMAEVAEELRRLADGHGAGVRAADDHPTTAFAVPTPASTPAAAATPAAPAATSDPAPAPRPAPPSEPAGDPGRRRRLAPVAVAAAVVLLLGAVGAALALDLGGGGGGDEDPAPAAEESSRAGSPSDADEAPEPTDEPPPEPTTPASTSAPPETTSAPAPEEQADAAGFVTDYYALLPEDTRAAWELLSDEMQAEVGSYGSYQGFWRTVDAVTVDDATEGGEGDVTVQLTYTTSRGTESETRLITVDETGDGLRIVGDQVV